MTQPDYSALFRELERDKAKIPGKGEVIAALKQEGRLLAVRGSMDYLDEIVPYCYAAEKLLVDPGEPVPSLDGYTVVLVGCPGNLREEWKEQLEPFVARGGSLVTTDWTLSLVGEVFPGKISQGGSGHGEFELTFPNSSHPFLEGCAAEGLHSWHLEAASYLVSVDSPQEVEIIAEAKGLWPSPIIVTFPHGRGMVTHFVSHFHLQKSDTKTRYASAFILTNIIEEAMKSRLVSPHRNRVRASDPPPPSSKAIGRVRIADARNPGRKVPRIKLL